MARRNLEDEIIDRAGKEMAAEIDRGVLWWLLQGSGWTLVKLKRFHDNFHAIDVRIWVEENSTDEFLTAGSEFLFKSSKDATMFILRWYD